MFGRVDFCMWLCMVVCVFCWLWLCMFVYRRVWFVGVGCVCLCMVVYVCGCSCMIVYDCVCVYARVCLRMRAYGFVWLYMFKQAKV